MTDALVERVLRHAISTGQTPGPATLETWLDDWIAEVSIIDLMFGEPTTRVVANPADGKPIEIKIRGKAIY